MVLTNDLQGMYLFYQSDRLSSGEKKLHKVGFFRSYVAPQTGLEPVTHAIYYREYSPSLYQVS